jgi:hypothetical protein
MLASGNEQTFLMLDFEHKSREEQFLSAFWIFSAAIIKLHVDTTNFEVSLTI